MVKAIIKASPNEIPLRNSGAISWDGYVIDPNFWQAQVPFLGYIEVDGTPICRGRVFDLSGPELPGLRIAGWGGGFTVEQYRHRGLWGNLLRALDLWMDASDFDWVAVRLVTGVDRHFKTLCPEFSMVKEKDEKNQSWFLKKIGRKDMAASQEPQVLYYLETKIKKW